MIDKKSNNLQIENNKHSKKRNEKLTMNHDIIVESKINLNENESPQNALFQKGQNTGENKFNDEYELSDELRQEIEKRVDLQFQDKYKKMSEYYEEKIFYLLNEQEKIFTRSEMIKEKINTLENYLKKYCKINGIDFDELISGLK